MDADYSATRARRVVETEAAQASLFARFKELARKLDVARETVDLRARIADRPFAAIGTALALGALVGMRKPKANAGSGGTISAAVAAVIVKLARDYALQRLARGAMAWWSGSREVGASYDSSIESMFKH